MKNGYCPIDWVHCWIDNCSLTDTTGQQGLENQIHKRYQIVWNIIYISGLLLFLVYGFGIKEMPILVAGTIEVSLAISLIIAKIIYG